MTSASVVPSASGLDGGPVANGVGRDADPVRVEVVRLHLVLEVQGGDPAALPAAVVVGRKRGLAADGQRHLRTGVVLDERWNTTFTSIVSPSSYVSPFAGEPTKETLLTAGTSLRLPSTLWPESAVSAGVGQIGVGGAVGGRLDGPPLRRIAFAATLIPSVSLSSSTTVYSKNRNWRSTGGRR